MNPLSRLVDLERRVANMLRVGAIHAVQASPPRVQVSYGAIITAWLPWMTTRAGSNATWWAPEVGEQVLLLAPSGDAAQAVVLPAVYQNSFPAPDASLTKQVTQYSDGTIISYDTSTSELAVTSTGKITIQCSELDITGNLKVTGGITATEDIEAGTISLEEHTHGGVEGGSGTTSPPIP